MTPSRLLLAALVASFFPNVFGESAPSVPPVAPAPVAVVPAASPAQSFSPQANMQPMGGPHISTEIHLVTLDSSGSLDAASQKLMDDLTQTGWRPMGMSTVSAAPVTLAIMFAKTAMPQRPALPVRPPQPLPAAPAPAQMPAVPVAPVQTAPVPAAPAAVQPKP